MSDSVLVLCAEGRVLSAVAVDVLLLRLCPYLVDLLLLHACRHRHCRVPFLPLQASVVLHHWSQGMSLLSISLGTTTMACLLL